MTAGSSSRLWGLDISERVSGQASSCSPGVACEFALHFVDELEV
jgi:hypothetical protein